MSKDWTEIQKKYKGQWVALDDDEETVVGAGNTVKDALKEARNNGNTDPILAYMPERIVSYVGVASR